MYFIFDYLFRGKFRKAIYLLFLHVLVVLVLFMLKSIGIFPLLTDGMPYELVFIHIPSVIICWYILISLKSKKFTFEYLTGKGVPCEEDASGMISFKTPVRLHEMGLGSYWVNWVINGLGGAATSLWILFGFIVSPIYLMFLLYLYIQGYESFLSVFTSQTGIISCIAISIQAKILLLNKSNSGSLWGRLSWLERLKNKSLIELLVSIDLLFLSVCLIFLLYGRTDLIHALLFLYGFRLMRILLFVPYFEEVWNSIVRGLRLTANYVISFLVILFVFAMNSRMLFADGNEQFSTLSKSIYSNFQIILGNGFDLAHGSSNLSLYVFFVTLLLGIVFTSIITALITDSLLEKKIGGTRESKVKYVWYRREKDEDPYFYTFRLLLHIYRI